VTDQELIGYLDRSFGELSQKFDEKIDGLHEELREEIRQTRTALEEGDRQTRVLIEAVRSDARLLAEGLMGQGETFARRQSETLLKIDEVKALIGPLYKSLNSRVMILEETMEREHSDVMDVIRERFGKR